MTPEKVINISILIFSVLYPILDAKNDVLVGKVYHRLQSVIVGLVFAVISLVFKNYQLFIVLCATRWIVFDFAYNRFKKESWFFIGSTSDIDKYVPPILHLIGKIAGLWISILFWIIQFIN